ncbi:MAG: hypothetical protein ACRD4O_20315, partial [Bryobacteraceae bacterium]
MTLPQIASQSFLPVSALMPGLGSAQPGDRHVAGASKGGGQFAKLVAAAASGTPSSGKAAQIPQSSNPRTSSKDNAETEQGASATPRAESSGLPAQFASLTLGARFQHDRNHINSSISYVNGIVSKQASSPGTPGVPKTAANGTAVSAQKNALAQLLAAHSNAALGSHPSSKPPSEQTGAKSGTTSDSGNPAATGAEADGPSAGERSAAAGRAAPRRESNSAVIPSPSALSGNSLTSQTEIARASASQTKQPANAGSTPKQIRENGAVPETNGEGKPAEQTAPGAGASAGTAAAGASAQPVSGDQGAKAAVQQVSLQVSLLLPAGAATSTGSGTPPQPATPPGLTGAASGDPKASGDAKSNDSRAAGTDAGRNTGRPAAATAAAPGIAHKPSKNSSGIATPAADPAAGFTQSLLLPVEAPPPVLAHQSENPVSGEKGSPTAAAATGLAGISAALSGSSIPAAPGVLTATASAPASADTGTVQGDRLAFALSASAGQTSDHARSNAGSQGGSQTGSQTLPTPGGGTAKIGDRGPAPAAAPAISGPQGFA